MTARRSQVFLTDNNWIQRLSTRIQPAEFGLEWACGKGALTRHLLQSWDYLLGLELEQKFCLKLVEKFRNYKFNIICTNILEYPLPEQENKYPLVSNLPYHLTGPLLIKILRNSPKLRNFRGLVQKEVAGRITSDPGDKNYGSLALLFDLCGEVNAVYNLPENAFTPPPDVKSTWIEFAPGKMDFNFESLRQFCRRCFRYPRKTLINNLVDNKENKSKWRKWLKEKDINCKIRPNNLTPELFREVYDKWQEK